MYRRLAVCRAAALWCYRFPARVSRELRLRQEEQPKPIREIAWKAQVRLCARYRQLARAGKPAKVVTAAIARELAGFSGPSPAACRRRRTDPGTLMITAKGGASEPTDTLLPGKAGGAAAVRRTLASTICRAIGRTQVARPRHSATHHRSCGPNPRIRVRSTVVTTAAPLALPSTAQSKRFKESHEFTRLLLGKADMRVERI